jgi:hypothetical protein
MIFAWACIAILIIAGLLYISAPYWWRRGWWRMPEEEMTDTIQIDRSACHPPPIRHDRRCTECGGACKEGARYCRSCGLPLRYIAPSIPNQALASAARQKVIRLD